MAQQRRSLSSFSSTAAMRNIQRDLHGTRMKLAVTPINTSSAQLQLQQVPPLSRSASFDHPIAAP
uniref:Uncharacterized protein n=2 Tax=Oryza TaxID=4527 RepID=A0A0D3FLE0_9ORYZ